jgi:MoaA/NifB/PqqE/SkfB family radical SAM enzyme
MRFREKIRWSKKILFSRSRRCLPEQVIFFVTDKCNLTCAHCFYWEKLNKETNEATLGEIEKFSKSLGRFSFLTLTGGEPFLRDDLPEIIKIFRRNNSVSKVDIPTNGFFTERILKTVEAVLAQAQGIDLTVKVSLDGLEERHDAIRGARGAFSKAVDTCHGLTKMKATNPSLKLGIIMTYSTLNQEILSGTLDYIEEKLDPDFLSLSFVRGNTRDPKIKEAETAGYLESYRRILSFLLQKKNRQAGPRYRFYLAYKSKISEMLALIKEKNRCLFPCDAGRLLCVIDSSLNVYPCEIIGRGFGNLRACGFDFRKLWFSREAELFRKEIKDTGCYCTYECGMQISAFFNLRGFLSLLPRMLWLDY